MYAFVGASAAKGNTIDPPVLHLRSTGEGEHAASDGLLPRGVCSCPGPRNVSDKCMVLRMRSVHVYMYRVDMVIV